MSYSFDTDALLLDAVQCAREAGRIQIGYFRSGKLDIQSKSSITDIVTAADKASEQSIINFIHEKYPTHSILSEESGEDGKTSDFQWVIDPLDGTTNFSAGLPLFCVSIGIRYKGETVVGVVFAPYLDELFHAVAGGGAFLNGNPIHCGNKVDLHEAVVSTGFPYDKALTPDNNLDNAERIMPIVRGYRRLGSAAIDICYVAAGNLDGYWEINLHQWDVCAGLLIAEEAGATIWHFRTDRNVSVLVGSPDIANAMRPLISTVPRKG
jgi:myo-inositol-1(or 4)-monophosphatase